jgi:hypothetical protein
MFSIIALVSTPARAEVTDCIAEMAKVIRANTFDHDFTVCATESAPWSIKFFKGYIRAMTDGTALRVFHMQQPDKVPVDEWPVPVVLMPKSEHVWHVGYMYKGEALPEGTRLREFA